ncbi:MAG: DUF1015 domain-containing protein [Solirubrobacterales bacterium]
MASISPMIGLRYNPEKNPNAASVVTPPYDVIDEKAQARYYAENPFNIIRLELGLIFPDDTEKNNRYTRAKKYLDKWQEDEVLIAESKPALYVYQQEFEGPHGTLIRNGFICGMKTEDYSLGNILPHEETLSKPKADRLKLMHATQSNFSSIFGMYDDPEKKIDQALHGSIDGREPDVEFVDEAGEIHRLWVVTNEKVVKFVVETFKAMKIYIADGHHRYETALQYSRDMEAAGKPGFDHVMTTLVNLHDDGLVVLPTHRVVGSVKGLKMPKFITALSDLFEVEKAGSAEKLDEFMTELGRRRKKKRVFGMYGSDKTLYFLTLKNFTQAKKFLPKERSDAWKKLDVAQLDNLILDHLLGIGEIERKNQDNLAYTRDENWAVQAVNNGAYQLAFLINSTKVEEVVAVAEAKDKMPQKSTYFYPKLITGLVLNPIFKNVSK